MIRRRAGYPHGDAPGRRSAWWHGRLARASLGNHQTGGTPVLLPDIAPRCPLPRPSGRNQSQTEAETKLYHNVRARPGLRVWLKGPAGNPNGVGAQVRLIMAPSSRLSPAAAGRKAPGGRVKSTDPFERFTWGAGIGRKTASCRSWARRSRRNSCRCAGPVARSLPARCPKASKKLKPTTTVRSGNFVDHLLHRFLRIENKAFGRRSPIARLLPGRISVFGMGL